MNNFKKQWAHFERILTDFADFCRHYAQSKK